MASCLRTYPPTNGKGSPPNYQWMEYPVTTTEEYADIKSIAVVVLMMNQRPICDMQLLSATCAQGQYMKFFQLKNYLPYYIPN